MGQYIYESHMGGLYCTFEELDYSDLYCDSCGDSDWYVGCAETMEDAWNLLKDQTSTFDDSICDTCPHNDDYEYCDEKCEEYQHSGGYNLSFVMKFLAENFYCKTLHEIYLISHHNDEEGWVLVDCDPKGFKFGERHALLHTVCPLEEFVPMIAHSLTRFLDGPCKDLKEIGTIKKKGKIIHIYECIEEMSDWCSKENWREVASYRDTSWYGYMKKEEVKLVDEQKFLEKYL